MDLCGAQTLRLSSPNLKTLHLVRHAQGIHNVALEEHGEKPESEKLFDAHLSQKGLQQASERRKEITKSGLLNTIELVITSPLRRAMETSIGVFRGKEDINISDDFLKANNYPPILALEICRERMGLYPCDRRASITTSRTCFPEIDFTMIESDEDALWKDKEREKLEEVATRGLQFFNWLWERPEKEIAIVSHGIFLQQTLLALHEKDGIPLEDRFLTRFGNCELRSIQIEKRHRSFNRCGKSQCSYPNMNSNYLNGSTKSQRKWLAPPLPKAMCLSMISRSGSLLSIVYLFELDYMHRNYSGSLTDQSATPYLLGDGGKLSLLFYLFSSTTWKPIH
ncbi:Phosphoglycerate mutase-like protein [Cardamine amara subsp. amara]|uniref:Phosphoglycerate mutase-like protein n=1 Tax=Cardamine amara subsp. amara TaxID=228776 RepID=A0ABD1BE75_CARAN